MPIFFDIRYNLLSLVLDRQCAFAATVDCNVRHSDGMSEPPNQPLYVPEACPTSGVRNHRTIAITPLSAQIVVVWRSNRKYRKDLLVGQTFL